MQTILHPLAPIYNAQSKILILGTMPSPKSREAGFYYAHPQNRFWPILSTLLCRPLPTTNEERTQLCLSHHIALWDVLHSCQIKGADDASIRSAQPNDLLPLLKAAPISAVFTNGSKATALYKRHCYPHTKMEAHPLPSTSPANCRYHTLETLIEAYRVLLPYLS